MDPTELSLTERFHLILLDGGLLFFIFLWIRRTTFFKVPFKNEQRHVAFSHVCVAFAIWLTVQLVFAPLAISLSHFLIFKKNRIFPLEEKALSAEVMSGLAISALWMSWLSVLLYLKFLNPQVQRSVWGSEGYPASFFKNVKNYLLGFSTWFMGFPAVVLMSQLVAIIIILLGIEGKHGEQVAVQQLKIATGSQFLLVMMGVTITCVVPILEEILFRGFLQTWLRQKFSRWVAIPMASLLFAWVHFSKDQGLENIELIASLFVLSCLLGYLFERQRSLWASIGLHSGFNMISSLMIMWKEL